MKKIVALAGAVVFAASACSSAFAKDDACPDIYNIRENGSKLATAFQYKDKEWVASSTPFLAGDSIWQVHFIELIPGVSNPVGALSIAQRDFNNFSMMAKPKVYNNGEQSSGVVICDYSPDGANYTVFAVNEVD